MVGVGKDPIVRLDLCGSPVVSGTLVTPDSVHFHWSAQAIGRMHGKSIQASADLQRSSLEFRDQSGQSRQVDAQWSQLAAEAYCCSSQEGCWELGALMLNCFRVACSAVSLPEKYAETALWNSSSCLCITFTCGQIDMAVSNSAPAKDLSLYRPEHTMKV